MGSTPVYGCEQVTLGPGPVCAGWRAHEVSAPGTEHPCLNVYVPMIIKCSLQTWDACPTWHVADVHEELCCRKWDLLNLPVFWMCMRPRVAGHGRQPRLTRDDSLENTV